METEGGKKDPWLIYSCGPLKITFSFPDNGNFPLTHPLPGPPPPSLQVQSTLLRSEPVSVPRFRCP